MIGFCRNRNKNYKNIINLLYVGLTFFFFLVQWKISGEENSTKDQKVKTVKGT